MTNEGLAPAYLAMPEESEVVPSEFVGRMNSLPKFVASTTLKEAIWDATVIEGDEASFAADLKGQGTALSSDTGMALSTPR